MPLFCFNLVQITVKNMVCFKKQKDWYNFRTKLRYNIGNREEWGNERDFIQRETYSRITAKRTP